MCDASKSTKSKILVVDDEQVLRDLLRRVLVRGGHEVLLAASGREALQAIAEHPGVDLVLTDVRMPEMSGPELATRLATPGGPPVIFMSGASDETPEALRRRGGRAFIKKPFRVQDILAQIAEVLSADARPLGDDGTSTRREPCDAPQGPGTRCSGASQPMAPDSTAPGHEST